MRLPVVRNASLARASLAVASLCLAFSSVSAQSLAPAPLATVATLPGVVVTAARSPQPLSELLADVTVIERDEIERSGAQSLAQLLQRQPGVEIQQFGGAGATSGVFLRGANTAQTVVLIDGVRTGSATAGTPTLEAIPIEQIERIEILRGPASSLYGADAIGGVIQVFTRRGEGRAFDANASIGYGTYNTSAAALGVAGSSPTSRYSLQLAGRRSDGFNAVVDPANFNYDPDRDGYRIGSVNASGAVTVANGHELSLDYLRSRLDSEFDAGDAFGDRTVSTLQNWRVASRDRWTEQWSTLLAVGQGRDESVSRTGFGDAPFRTDQTQYLWQNDFQLRALGALTLALERREERVSTDVAFAVTGRDTNSVTAVYQVARDAHSLQANLRYDDSSQFGGRTTGALLYGYRFSPQWRVTVGGSTAFRAPTFNDLYYPDFSNPNLQPEKARGGEAALHFSTRMADVAIDASATGWYTRVRDLIVFGCDANFVCIPNNVAQATLQGATLTGAANWRTTSLQGSITLQDPVDSDTNRLLPRRARTHGSIALRQDVGAATLGAELVASSSRFDDVDNRVRLGGYAIVNLTAEWRLPRGITLFVRGDNVFDGDYELASGYSSGGARVFGGVRWQL